MGKIDTIKYLKLHNKIYEVEKISFFYWYATVRDTPLTEQDVSQEEILDFKRINKMKIAIKQK